MYLFVFDYSTGTVYRDSFESLQLTNESDIEDFLSNKGFNVRDIYYMVTSDSGIYNIV